MALKTERESVDVDGVEVQVPLKKHRVIDTSAPIKFTRKDGLTGRQNLESQAKRIGKGVWDYITGEGDDIERARKLLQDESDDD